MNSYGSTKKNEPRSLLTVSVPASKDGVFSDNSPVQALETVLAAVFGQLIYSAKSAQLEPGLLKRFSWDFENKWYVLELKENVRFHNGRLANADDLEFSLIRGLLSPKGSWYKTFFANLEGIETIGNQREFKSGMVSGISKINKTSIRVKLSSPNPSFLHSLARSYFTLVPQEELRSDYITWKRYPVGAGPYRVDSCPNACKTAVLYKVDAKSNGVDAIRIISSGKGLADLDLNYSENSTSLTQKISEVPFAVTGIYFNFENDLGKDLHFRRAIAYSIKRTDLTQGVPSFSENNELLSSQFWGRINKPEVQDLDLAKKEISHLKKKVAARKFRIPVFGADTKNSAMIAYLKPLSKQLLQIGLDVEFFVSEKKFFDEKDSEIPMRIISLGADLNDPTVLFGLFRNGSPMKPHYPTGDTAFDALYLNASRAESLDSKVQAVKELSDYFVQHVYAVPLFEKRSVIGVNAKVVKNLGKQDGGNLIYLDRVQIN